MSKRRKVVDGRYVITKTPTEILELGDGSFRIMRLTVKEMLELNEVIKEKTKYFKLNNKKRKKENLNPIDCFYIHLSPNVSFFIKME